VLDDGYRSLFKGINDGYGHLAGDIALKESPSGSESQIRSMDTAARFGGDELAISVARHRRRRGHEARRAHPANASRTHAGRAHRRDIERNLTVSWGRYGAFRPGGTRPTSRRVSIAALIADADAAL